MTKEEQDKIDEMYSKVWDLVDDLSSLKGKALEIGEALKEFVSPEVFK